jgi:Ala-tRNA(Pro) deacylase
MAKAVVLKDDKGYLVAVIPATYKLGTGELYDLLGRRLEMAGEGELPGLFGDCDLGAVPPVADAYGIETVCDEGLAKLDDVYFEGGDHTSLVRVSGEDFMKLMGDARRGVFSHHV